MSDVSITTRSKTLLPELPKDVPIPAYRYQRDERDRNASGLQSKESQVANLLADLQLLGCAAATR